MADALTHRGIEVTIASRTPSLLPTVEPTFGDAVATELQEHRVRVFTSVEAHAIVRTGDSPWDPVQMAAHHWAAGVSPKKMEIACKK
jgi:pyruvate/2-oxoglutarate dehydrogenase complex dihydrolipoamide dehydrogenase (E3) component